MKRKWPKKKLTSAQVRTEPAASLVKTTRFRWVPGMRWRGTQAGGNAFSGTSGRFEDDLPPEGALPDLEDVATAGCLIPLLGDDLANVFAGSRGNLRRYSVRYLFRGTIRGTPLLRSLGVALATAIVALSKIERELRGDS